MEVLRGLIQDLIVIIILAMFFDMLLPAGEMRKYVKIVMGLLIIVAVVQAVGDLVNRDYTSDLPSLTEKDKKTQLSILLEAGKKISYEQQQKAIEQYKRGLSNQVVALASMNKEISVVDAEVKVCTDPGDSGFGLINEIVMVIGKEHGQAIKHPAEGGVTGVEPVTVQVGRYSESEVKAKTEAGPPREVVAELVKTIANFYNLKPEQVKCVYQ